MSLALMVYRDGGKINLRVVEDPGIAGYFPLRISMPNLTMDALIHAKQGLLGAYQGLLGVYQGTFITAIAKSWNYQNNKSFRAAMARGLALEICLCQAFQTLNLNQWIQDLARIDAICMDHVDFDQGYSLRIQLQEEDFNRRLQNLRLQANPYSAWNNRNRNYTMI